eukprot:974430_1
MCFGTRALRTQAIILAWFNESDNMWQLLCNFGNVESAASFANYPDEQTNAASVSCSAANESSNSEMYCVVPEMFRVPPAPQTLFLIAPNNDSTTSGCCHMFK